MKAMIYHLKEIKSYTCLNAEKCFLFYQLAVNFNKWLLFARYARAGYELKYDITVSQNADAVRGKGNFISFTWIIQRTTCQQKVENKKQESHTVFQTQTIQNCLKVSVIASYFLRVHLTTLSQSVVCTLCQGTNFLLPKMIGGVNPHIQRPPRPVRIWTVSAAVLLTVSS